MADDVLRVRFRRMADLGCGPGEQVYIVVIAYDGPKVVASICVNMLPGVDDTNAAIVDDYCRAFVTAPESPSPGLHQGAREVLDALLRPARAIFLERRKEAYSTIHLVVARTKEKAVEEAVAFDRHCPRPERDR